MFLKQRCVVLVLSAALIFGAASAVSAIDMSVGGSLFYAGDGGGGVYGVEAESGNVSKSETVPWDGFGFGGFFDLTYAELGLNVTFGWGKNEEEGESPDGVYWEKSKKDGVSFASLNISALGKYPVVLGEKMTAFPAAGFEYAVVVSATRTSGGQSSDATGPVKLSALWLKFGGGLDYAVNDKLFARPELLYGVRFSNTYESSLAKNGSNAEPALGHGWTIKLGLGYKL